MSEMGERVADLSEKVGGQNAALEGLTRLFDRHCDDDDRRHVENVQALRQSHEENIANFREVFAELKQINTNLRTVNTLVLDVAEMKPHIESYKTFRVQVALLVVIVTGAVSGTLGLLYLALSHFGEIKEVLAKFLGAR